MRESHWKDAGMKCFGMLIDGRAKTRKQCDRRSRAQQYEGPDGFNLPKVPEPKNWRLLVDTNSLNKDSSFAFGETYEVTGHSFLCFLLEGAKPPA
jgi:isoamylase